MTCGPVIAIERFGHLPARPDSFMNITRELPVPPVQPALDEVKYQLSADELSFLKIAVSQDPEEIKRRAENVRKE